MLTIGKHSSMELEPLTAMWAGNRGELAMAKKARDAGIEIDSQWFFDRLNAQKLSLRGLAKMMDMSPSSLSLRLDGQYKITMEEAAEMAPLLGVTFEEIVLHAGIKVPKAPGGGIKVIGQVSHNGNVKLGKGGGTVQRPGWLPAETVAIVDPESGWTYFYAPSGKLHPEAVGRLTVVETGGGATSRGHSQGARGGSKTVLGVFKRGSERGLWDVIPPCCGHKGGVEGGSDRGKGGVLEGVEGALRGVRVVTATPVLLILP